MPVVFLCHNCRCRLKVGRKKIGSEVECPRCRVPLTVPAAEGTGTTAPAAAETENPTLRSDLFPEFAVFDDPLPLSPPPPPSSPQALKGKQDSSRVSSPRGTPEAARKGQPSEKTATKIATIEPPRSRPASPAPLADKPSRRPRGAGGTHALGFVKRDDQPSSYSDPLLIRRRTLYLQAALILLMAVAGLALGYFIGRGIGPGDRSLTGGDSDVEITGTLTFRDGRGEELPDSGAVVIALPEEIAANKLVAAAGLGPQVAHDPGRIAEMAIEELGGKYDRTDARGNFALKLARPGSYRLLLISRGARRPAGEVVTAGQLREMQRYFAAPADLIGGHKYVWAVREVTEPRLAILHAF